MSTLRYIKSTSTQSPPSTPVVERNTCTAFGVPSTFRVPSWVITGVTLTFYIVVSFAIVLTLRTGKEKAHAEAPKGMPAVAGAK